MVGEVRWASTGAGSSWKLSGGSMWSTGVTKVSKNRQVRRAISRRARASAVEIGSRPATRGDRLAQRAMAGEAIHSAANAAARGHVPRSAEPAATSATTRDDERAGHPTIESEEIEPRTDASPAPLGPIPADGGG